MSLIKNLPFLDRTSDPVKNISRGYPVTMSYLDYCEGLKTSSRIDDSLSRASSPSRDQRHSTEYDMSDSTRPTDIIAKIETRIRKESSGLFQNPEDLYAGSESRSSANIPSRRRYDGYDFPDRRSGVDNRSGYPRPNDGYDFPDRRSGVDNRSGYPRPNDGYDFPDRRSGVDNRSGYPRPNDGYDFPDRRSGVDNRSGYPRPNDGYDFPDRRSGVDNRSGYPRPNDGYDFPDRRSGVDNRSGYPRRNDGYDFPDRRSGVDNRSGYPRPNDGYDFPDRRSGVDNRSGYPRPNDGYDFPDRRSGVDNRSGYPRPNDGYDFPDRRSGVDNRSGYPRPNDGYDFPDRRRGMDNRSGYPRPNDGYDLPGRRSRVDNLSGYHAKMNFESNPSYYNSNSPGPESQHSNYMKPPSLMFVALPTGIAPTPYSAEPNHPHSYLNSNSKGAGSRSNSHNVQQMENKTQMTRGRGRRRSPSRKLGRDSSRCRGSNPSKSRDPSRGRGNYPGRGRGSGRSEGPGKGLGLESHPSPIHDKFKDEVKPIGPDMQTEKATSRQKKDTFLFFVFKNMSDESFDYVAYLKSRTESLQSVEYSIEDYMKTGNSKVVLALFPSKASAKKVTTLFRKTNSSSAHEVLCYLQDFIPTQYQELTTIDLSLWTKTTSVEAEDQIIKEKKPAKEKKKKKSESPDVFETVLYIRIPGALESHITADFIKTRLGVDFPHQFHLVSSTLTDNTSSTNAEIKVSSEAIANMVIRQLEDSNTDSSTNVMCSLIPFSSSSNKKEVIQQVLSDITNKAKQRIDHHNIKIKETTTQLEQFIISSNVSVEEYQRKVAVRSTIETQLEERKSQSREFLKMIDELKTSISQSKNIAKLSKQFSIECCRLDTALPIYARRSDILSCVTNNQVIILRGATGSGKSTQIAQYLYESDLLKEKMIVCTQPRKVACVSLATRVSEELLVKLGTIVGYRTGLKHKTSKETKILFMTDHTLLNECLKDPLFTKYSVIIIDEAHERSIYTDLLLGIVKKCLPNRPDLKVIISSATVDIQVFTDYFQSSKPIEVAGRTFPVEVVWKSEQPSDDYEGEAVKMVLQVHKEEGPGDILVFMTTPLETEKCKERLETNLGKDNNSFKCLTLHGQLNIQEQQLVFEPLPENQRKIVFATNTAETSITIPGIKYVIDTGLAKEMNFDPKRNINCLTVNVISQSSAEQRKGRAGRTSPGKCYRLYTEQTFLDMKTSNVPEILRVHLGQALLKLLQFGIDLSECDFVESPSQDALDSALKTLVLLNAVENGKITEHGNWLARVPLEPRLSTIVKNGFDKGFMYDALVVASLVSSGGSPFYRGGTKADKDKSDVVKTKFCQHQGDCFTLLKVYKEWIAQPEGKRNKWCFENYVNSKVIRGVHDTITEISGILERELKIEVKKEFSTDDHLEEDIQKLILSTFSENIAHFTGHQKVGYFVPSLDQQVFIHPSSSLKVLNDTSDWVVFCNVLRTSTDFITNVTPVKEEWIRGMMKLNFNIEDVKSKQISNVHTEYFGSNAFSVFVGPRFTNLREYEKILTQICGCIVMIDADRDLGEVRFYASTFTKTAQEAIAERRDKAIQVVLMKTDEFQLGSKSSRDGGVRIVLGKGGESTLLLMPLEYRSVHITMPNCQTSSKEHITEKFSRFGEIVNCWQDKKSDGRWGCVTYSTKDAAKEAVECTKYDATDVAVPEIKQSKRYNFEFKSRLTWSRRPTKGRAHIDINPIVFGDVVRLESILLYGKLVSMTINDKSTGISLRRLPPNTKESDIKESICSALNFVSDEEKDNIQKVIVVREKAEATSVDELDNIKRTISGHISNYLSGQTGFVVNVMKPKKDTAIDFVAYANFYSAEDGYRACNGLNGAMQIKNQVVTMTPDISSSINISQQVYDTMKPSIDEAVKSLQKTHDFKFHAKTLKNRRVVLNFYSRHPSGIATARTTIEGILKGVEIECWENENYRYFFLKQGHPAIHEIETKTNTAIIMDRRVNILRVIGTPENTKKAEMELQVHVDDLVKRSGIEINLRDLGRPKGLMQVLMKHYGLNLEQLPEHTGLQSVLLNHKRQTVKVIGESDALDTACSLINDLSESLLLESHYIKGSHSATSHIVNKKAPSQAERLPACCTCLCPIESITDLYRLEHCSHPYCLDCFGQQIQVAIQSKDLPVLCSEDTCQKTFAWVDFKHSFTKSQIEPRALVGAAVTNFMSKSGRGIYHHCLTPDCPVIYKTNTENTQYICEECGIRICSSCHIEYHDGLSCAMYRSQEKDSGQIEEYLRSHANSVKPCPNCRVPIEKNHGCNHMFCPACKVDFCWLCIAKFNNPDECYDHLLNVHGEIATLDDLVYNY